MTTSATITARQATPADLDAIMDVEQDWEESQRASGDMMLSRLRKFPAGFWLFDGPNGDVVGTLTSFPMRYDPRTAAATFKNWDAVTNGGYLPDIDLPRANALYLVSGSLKRAARGGRGYEVMMGTPVRLAEKLGLDYVVTGAKIPGYDAYCRRFGEIDAREYAFTRIHGCLVDPFLEMYRGHHYVVPDRHHIVAEYYPDVPSRDYGAIVVRQVVQAT